MRWLRLVWQVHCLYCCAARAIDVPLQLNMVVHFTSSDILNINIQLENLPGSPRDGSWESSVYRHTNDSHRKIDPFKTDLRPDNRTIHHVKYHTTLYKEHDNSVDYLILTRNGVIFYKEKIVTLVYDIGRPEPRHKCLQLNECVIQVNTWTPRVIITSPQKDVIEFYEGDKVELDCKSAFSRKVVWIDSRTGDEVDNTSFVLNARFDGTTLQCIERAGDGAGQPTIKSERSIKFIYVSQKPHVAIIPIGSVAVKAGESVVVQCIAYNTPDNTHTVMYRDAELIYEDITKKIKKKIVMKEGDTFNVRCMSTFTNARSSVPVTVQSHILTVNQSTRCEITLGTQPELAEVTLYRRGDRFTGTCTASAPDHCADYRNVQVLWINGDNSLNSGIKNSSVDIALDESHNGSLVRCVASGYVDAARGFRELCARSTTLTLREENESAGFDWFLVLKITLPLTVAAVALVVYACRRTSRPRDHDERQVDNELYVSGSDDAVVYAQIYEQRQAAAALPPAPSRSQYAQILGYLQRNH